MRATFGCESHACGCCHQQEARALTTCVVEAIEPAIDQRIVERADGNESLTEEFSREASGGKHEEQIVLRNPKFDMLPAWLLRPLQRRGDTRVAERVRTFSAREDAALIDESAEVRRDGHIRRGGEQRVRERAAMSGQVIQNLAERHLRRLARARLCKDLSWRYRSDCGVAFAASRREGRRVEHPLVLFSGARQAGKALPFASR